MVENNYNISTELCVAKKTIRVFCISNGIIERDKKDFQNSIKTIDKNKWEQINLFPFYYLTEYCILIFK